MRPTTKTYRDVRRLREQNMTNRQIAVALGRTYRSITNIAAVLVKRGEIAKRVFKRNFTFEMKQIHLQIKTLYDQGMTRSEIAARLGKSKYAVGSMIQLMFRRGIIERRNAEYLRARKNYALRRRWRLASAEERQTTIAKLNAARAAKAAEKQHGHTVPLDSHPA